MTFPVLAASNPSGYNISRSVRLRSSASAYFTRTPAVAGNRKLFTISTWVKRGALGANQDIMTATSGAGGTVAWLRFNTSDQLDYVEYNGAGFNANAQTTAVFRDPGAWYYITVAFDSAQATAANRLKVYVNNVQYTLSGTYPTLNLDSYFSGTGAHYIGREARSAIEFFNGYLAEFNFIDGQALTPSSFGSTNATTGVWQPAKYTGTYGTNGFYLNFSDNSAATAAAIGKDYSGNGNNWTPNNISVTAGTTYDSMIDVPTPYADGSTNRGNYAVMNPIVPTGSAVISGGNLNIVGAGTYCNGLSTISLDSGAYYAECVVTTHAAEAWGVWDITKTAAANTGATPSGFYGIYSGGATLMSNGSNLFTNAAGTPANGDIVQVAWSNGKVWVGKNNTWYDSSFGTTGNPGAGTNATFTGLTAGQFAIIFGSGNASPSLSANFGQRPFSYTPPSGFKALNTYNLPASTITNGGKYMAATTYTGNGSTQSITNAGSFKPDLVWGKSRSLANSNWLMDSVRGTGVFLSSDQTIADTATSTLLTSFNTNGFSIGSSLSCNQNAATYVGWQWQAGQGSTSSNTSGSITSTVSVNATAGFSVVTFNAGAAGNKTVGHGLGVKPAMFIWKDRTAVSSWHVWQQSYSNQAQGYMTLNSTSAVANDTRIWANTAPTSTVLSFESGYTFTANDNVVAYCWSEIAGFSKFGSYTGNGSTDGTFVYCGFRPRYVLIKEASGTNAATSGWSIQDTSRAPYNQDITVLQAQSSAAEASNATYGLDALSNGFKLRSSNQNWNESGGTYIYAAFAENPFSVALAR